MMINVQPFFSAFFTVAEEIEESGVIGVRDRITVYVKGIQMDGMHRTFVRFPIRRAHLKRSAGDQYDLIGMSLHRQHNQQEKQPKPT